MLGSFYAEESPKNNGCSQNNTGNPCNAATGNKYLSQVDIDSELRYTRYYNSYNRNDIGLGVGWISNFHRRLEPFGDLLVVHQADGRRESWKKSGDVWLGDSDSELSISESETGFRVLYPGGRAEEYDSAGRLQSDIAPAGQTTRFSYDADGLLTSVTAPFGHALRFGYDDDNRLSTVTDSDDRIYAYGYDDNGNLASVQYPDGETRNYHYEDANFPSYLTGITDERGVRISTYAYQADGKAVRTEQATTDNGAPQESLSFSYDSDSNTIITDAAGHQRALTFVDTLGVKRLSSEVNLTDGRQSTRTYDPRGNLLAVTDEVGNTTSYTYNATNQKITQTAGDGSELSRTTTYEYLSPTIDLITREVRGSVFDGAQREVVTRYDDNLNPVLVTINGFAPDGTPISRSIGFAYNKDGQLVTIDGPRVDVNDITTYTYHDCDTGSECGQLASMTNALNQVTTYDRYDANGRLTRMTGPNDVTTELSYHPRGWLASTRVATPSGVERTTRYAYDATGQLIEVTWHDGSSVRYEYDDSRYLRAIVDESGNRQSFDYDLKGNPVRREIESADQVTVSRIEMAYDHRDHVIELNEAGSITRTINDAMGRATSLYDANQNPPATFVYDALDRLTRAVDPLGGITSYVYDANDRASSVTAPNGSTTKFIHDDLGNLIEENSADRGRTTYRYDEAGNRIEKTGARGEVVQYQYDALGRLVEIDHAGEAEDQSFQWDVCQHGIGRICVIHDQSGVTAYQYDSFGNVVSQTRTDGVAQFDTTYQWDARDRLVSMIYPNGRQVTWERDARGRIVSMQSEYQGEMETIVDARAYRADGALVGQLHGNGISEAREYDLRGLLINHEIGSETPRQYAYDPNGNVTSIGQAEAEKRYGYDALDRLTGETRISYDANQAVPASEIILWKYDANGNRVLQTKGSGSPDEAECTVPSVECIAGEAKERQYVYSPNSNRLESNGKKDVVLDTAGNTLSDRGGARAYRYNAANRLYEYIDDGVRKATYTYNARNQRTGKVVYESDGVTVKRTMRYLYDIDGRLISEYRNGEPIRDYLWIDETLVRQDQFWQDSTGMPTIKQRLTVITDHLNTPRLAYDSQQNLVWKWDSNGFGKGGVDRDADDDGRKRRVRLRFPGQYWDAESGLYYNHHRYL